MSFRVARNKLSTMLVEFLSTAATSCSIFRDLQEEREHLIKKIFPELQFQTKTQKEMTT